MCLDVTLGEYRLFIDGAEINGLQTSAGSHTRTDEAGAIIRVGRNYTASADSGINSLIDDVQLFNIVQHTESFTGEVPRTLPASPSTYRVLTTFVIYEPNLTRYIESSGGLKSSPVVVDLSGEMISVSNIDTMDGNTAVNPSVIYRKIYLEKKASGETSYGEPFFLCDIIDNTTTTLNITADPTSTITPPSVSELDQLSSKQMVFSGSAQYLEKVNQAYVQRFDSNGSESTSPDFFDYLGTDSIYLYPKLSSAATIAQRTLIYWIYRRPHEIFDDVDRLIDMPIQLKKVLIQGVVWKSYEYNDRDGKVSEFNKYEQMKKEAINKMTRQKGKPTPVRDVNGDSFGYSV